MRAVNLVPFSEIYQLFVNFAIQCDRLHNLDITGLKFYPGDEQEWVIEDATTQQGIVVNDEGLISLNEFLKINTQLSEYQDSPNTAKAAIIYEQWCKYVPIHQRLHNSEDHYPCLTFFPDHYISIEDVDSNIDWSGQLDEAIALLNLCVKLEVSFVQIPRASHV